MVFYAILDFFTNLGIFSVFVPFILAFTLSYAVLEKTKIFDNQKYNVITALVIGLLTASSMQISVAINSFMQKVGLGIIVMLAILMILGLFRIKDTSKLYWIGILVFIAIIYFQFSNEAISLYIKNLILNRYTIILLAALITFGWIIGFKNLFPARAQRQAPQIAAGASEVLGRSRLEKIGEIPGEKLGIEEH